MSGSAISRSTPARRDVPRRPLRRLTLELFGVVALKIVLLALLWWVAFAPHPRPDSSPAAIEHLLAPATPPAQGARP